MIQVEIDSIRVSLMTQDRVVVLKDMASDRYLPIWIGPFEADALRVELAGMDVSRPLTHDLLKVVLTKLGGSLEHITVSDLRNDVFYASLAVSVNGDTVEIDSRPSDALNLAVRLNVPIYVEDTVMEKAGIEPDEEIDGEGSIIGGDGEEVGEQDLGAFKDFLDTLDLDNLGDE